MRLIDADALIAEYDRVHIGAPGGARKLMQDAHTVDAVEVVHGRWIWHDEDEFFTCSNCEYSALNNYRGNSVESNYCPNCGAKMMPQPPKGE